MRNAGGETRRHRWQAWTRTSGEKPNLGGACQIISGLFQHGGRIRHAGSLCVETLHRDLGMAFYCDGVRQTGTLRVALHMVKEGLDELTPKAVLAIVLEDGQSAELVVAIVLRAAYGADWLEGRQQTQQKVRRGRVEAR